MSEDTLAEALARADVLTDANHWGGDAQHIRVLADRVRELEAAKESAKKKESPKKK